MGLFNKMLGLREGVMARDFFFEKPTLDLIRLEETADKKWSRLKNRPVQLTIAAEEQYLQFHLHMLEYLRHTEPGRAYSPPYKHPIGLSLRAGAVKAGVLLCTSIIEAALRAHAELRGYPLHHLENKRTFGNVLFSAWRVDDMPREEVEPIWETLKSLHGTRNQVHLHESAKVSDGEWNMLLSKEGQLLQESIQIIEYVSKIRT